VRVLGTVVIAAVACGDHHEPEDAPVCTTQILYLDRFGGAYDHASRDDSTSNVGAVFDGPRALPPWPGDDVNWADLTDCIRTALAPFAIEVTGPVIKSR
jgi:hypothetical protein